MSAAAVTVLVDGVPVADSSTSFHAGDLVVMMGLGIDWGRQTVVDQPDADSASLQIAQRGGHDLIAQLAAGRALEIRAAGMEHIDPSLPTITDGGFEATAVGSKPANVIAQNAAATVTAARASTGAQSLALSITDTAAEGAVVVAPAAIDTQNPAAWDHIPHTDADLGLPWPITVAVWAPLSAVCTLQALAFFSPAGASSVDGPVQHIVGTGGWQTVSWQLFPSTSDRWVGVRVAITAPAWQQIPGTWAGTPGTWADYRGGNVDDVAVTAPSGEIVRTVVAFAGRITDLEAHYDVGLEGGTLVADVTARGFPADLQNDRIGDQPWQVEPLADRVNRILTLAGGDVTAIIDPTIATIPVTYRDVDAQPAAGLVAELAASAAAVAWPAVHATHGPYYWLEDPDNRSALFVLYQDPDTGLVQVIPASTAADAIVLDAANVLLSPLRWVQSVADIGTRADVTWLEQTVDDQGKPAPTERHYLVVDAQLEAEYGTRGISLSTQLQAESDAADVAARLLARVGDSAWRLSGVEWDQGFEAVVDAGETKTTLDLLDGTVRIGHPLRIDNIPNWAPLPPGLVGYIEGGHYEYRHAVTDGANAGAWSLALTLSPGLGLGGSVPWVDLDNTWSWNEFDSDVSWSDLIGVTTEG